MEESIVLLDKELDVMDFTEEIYEERTAAKVAGFLRAIGLDVHAYMTRPGVRGDWMEQDGPKMFMIEKENAIGWKNRPMAGFDRKVIDVYGHCADWMTAVFSGRC